MPGSPAPLPASASANLLCLCIEVSLVGTLWDRSVAPACRVRHLPRSAETSLPLIFRHLLRRSYSRHTLPLLPLQDPLGAVPLVARQRQQRQHIIAGAASIAENQGKEEGLCGREDSNSTRIQSRRLPNGVPSQARRNLHTHFESWAK
jgi:hypothetical protein